MDRKDQGGYHAPELIEYGSIAKLTEGGPKSIASDHGHNMMRP